MSEYVLVIRRQVRTQLWPLVVALALILAAAVAVQRTRSRGAENPSPLERLHETWTAETRMIEPRLTGGFAWAPLRPARRGEAAAGASLARLAAGNEVLAATRGDDSPRARQLSGVAELFVGRADDAMQSFREAVRVSPNDGEVWSDLAAATFVAASRSNRADLLPDALAASDRALAVDPTLAEAAFNRALVIETFGLRDEAVTAWRRYLALDSTGGWADEARAHVERLRAPSSAATFDDARPRIEAAARAGNQAEVVTLVDQARQQSRRFFEYQTLADWGHPILAGDEQSARASLDLARAVGDALRTLSGEKMLADSVAVIDRATPAQRRSLAAGHVAYFEAGAALGKQGAAAAEPLFAEAAAALHAGGSPFAFMARWSHANAVYDSGRADQARDLLRQIESEHPDAAYLALRGHVGWTLGLSEASLGDWDATAASFEQSTDAFERAGEAASLAFVRSLQAEVYDRLSDPERAWRLRRDAWPALGKSAGGNRLCVSLSAAVDAALRESRYDAALALIALTIEESRVRPSAQSRPAIVDVQVRQALIHLSRGDEKRAEEALRDARTTAAGIVDAAARDRALAYVSIGEAALLRANGDDDTALARLDFAASVYEQRSENAELPLVQFERARTLRAAGRNAEAWSSLTDAIRRMDEQRGSVRELELRAGVFDSAAGLFREAVDLAMQREQPEGALRYVETARGRSLLEEIAGHEHRVPPVATLADIQRVLPANAVLLEPLLLEDRLVTFVIQKNDFRVSVVRFERRRLQSDMATFVDAIAARRSEEEVRRLGAQLYDVLLRDPLSGTTAQTLIIAPDPFLHAVPWSALRDAAADQYVVQRRAVQLVPSGTYLTLPQRARGAVAQALIVRNPLVEGLESLSAATPESRSVAAAYDNKRVLAEREATREAFLDAVRDADVVHFAGHGTSDRDGTIAGALLFSGGEDERLYASDVAKLSLPRTQLVVLAACDTFVGARQQFEWTPTLSHAFLAAGVPSVIGTLWPIEDAPSAQLFGRFHQAYARGQSARDALRQAQLALLAQDDATLRHPASWAGVEMLGR